MDIEEFKKFCLEKNRPDQGLIEEFEKLKEEQKKYGSRYRPIYSMGIASHRDNCPNCGFKLQEIFVRDDGWTIDHILNCKNCGYRYAMSRDIR